MLQRLKNFARGSVPIYCASVITFDILQGIALKFGFNKRYLGTLEGGHNAGVQSTLARIDDTVHSYMRGSAGAQLRGTVAEVGPGDNLGVSMMLAANGAQIVHAVDRFNGLRPWDQQLEIYKGLFGDEIGRHIDMAASPPTPYKVEYRCGKSAEDYFGAPPVAYDAIYSFAVLEHVIDPILCLNLMQQSIAPGGAMVHVVDFSDHGMLGKVHPLKFLIIPRAIYRYMVRNGARPNRYLLHEYKKWVVRSGVSAEILIRRLIDGTSFADPVSWNDIGEEVRQRVLALVRQMRPRFAAEFADAPDEDLAVAEAIVSVRRGSA